MIGKAEFVAIVVKNNLYDKFKDKISKEAYEEVKEIMNKYPTYSESQLVKKILFECTYRFY
jgi:hypothetical protein